MRINDLPLHRFHIFPPDVSARQALAVLEKSALIYGLVECGGEIKGYIDKTRLKQVAGDPPCVAVAGAFTSEAHGAALIGVVAGKLSVPCLIRDHQGVPEGILDVDSLLMGVQSQEQANRQLAEEVDSILNFSSDEIYITDGRGVTLRVNKAFEENSGVAVCLVLGKNVADLEQEGFFRPSVARLVLEQKTKVTTLQEYQNKKKVLVTGTPVFDEHGTVCRVIINTRDTSKLNRLKSELEEIESLKDRYFRELLHHLQEDVASRHIVAKSKPMKQLLGTARKVAEVDSIVLLLGETGVGKGLVARYIHDNSARSNQIFVTVNCGAIPENLLESELFGYEPGAFTGADRRGKTGRIELADKGTLLLDEIGDLPASLQVKLLHIIQEGAFTRIGGSREIRPNVRILAATNRPLARMVENGTFRDDLFYRLNVIPLEIPPLQQRREDIPALAERFMAKCNQKYRKTKEFSPASLQFLENYHWPGNVRELENLVERLVIVVSENLIEPYHLPETIKMANLSPERESGPPKGGRSLERIKDDIEKQLLERLYDQFRNTYKMAELLGINQSTVVRKLKKHGITGKQTERLL